MDTKMNEEQYRKMISLDIEFLKQLPDSLERKHIVSILKESVEMYYSSDGTPANSKPANCAIFDVSGSLLTDAQSYEIAQKFYEYCYMQQDDSLAIGAKAIPLIFDECLKMLASNDR